MAKHRIAVVAGDGIGKEVMPEGLHVMDAAARKFGIDLQFDHFDFSSWDYFEKHGKMLPDNWKDLIGGHDAIYFGAVGWPEKIPDHVSLWGSLLLFRREFDQYVNLRPARLMPGIIAPVVRRDGSPRMPGEIDMYIVRENTEGEYSSLGGRMYPGTEREIVMQETVMSRIGVDRVLKFAFELAQSRPKKHLTLSLIHISEPTRLLSISYAVFCLKKKKHTTNPPQKLYTFITSYRRSSHSTSHH